MNTDVIGAAVQIAVGLIFLQAAVGKLSRWREFRGILGAYHVLPQWAVPVGAVGVVLAELLTGLALVVAWRIPLTAVAAAGLFVIFAAAMALNLIRGRKWIDCGCFQSARQSLEWRWVVRNLICAGLVLGASASALDVADPSRWLHALPAGVALFAIYLAMNAVWALDASRSAAFTRS